MQLTAQQRAAIELPPELVVSAAAGSGKTEVLVRRVLRAALDLGVPLERMLIVTFTRSAAAELRERLRRSLSERLSDLQTTGEPLAKVRQQLAALDRAQISTIHSFCLDLVGRYGHLLGLNAARILPDDEARMLRHAVCGAVVRTELRNPTPALADAALAWGGPDGIGADDLSRVQSSRGLRDILLRLHDFRCSLPDVALWQRQHINGEPLDPERSDPEHPLVQAALEPLRKWCRELSAASRELEQELQCAGVGNHAATLLRHRCAVLEELEQSSAWEDLGCAFALLDVCLDLPYKPSGLLASYARDVDDDLLKERIKELAADAQRKAKELRRFYAQPWREVALRENTTRGQIKALWDLAEQFATTYNARKRELGSVDYADLEAAALRLLSADDLGVAPEVRARLDMVLVDEYQDTNPLQDAIIELVTPDTPKSRFIVGDLKQSIYAFRLAEPTLFGSHHARLDGNSAAGAALRLTGNFRSRASIIAAVNHIFDGLLTPEVGGEDYAQNRLNPAVDYRDLCGAGFSADKPARLHLVTVDRVEPEQEEDGNIEEEVEDTVAFDPQYAKVAELLREIHAGAEPIYDKQLRATRPVQWRDMAVLLRTSRGRVEALRHELERAGIPSYAPGRSGFYERPEVSDALSLLAVVDNPRQDIPLAAVLTGPAVGLSPADLARIVLGSSTMLATEVARTFGVSDLWSKVERYLDYGTEAALRERLAQFNATLTGWRDYARLHPLPQLLDLLYRESGLLVAAAGLKNGAQRLANLAALAERACQFSGHGGLGAFLEYIRASRRAAGDSGEAPLLSDEADVVRVLTVHQAKGLEFPVVVVPDLQRRFNLPELGEDVQWHYRAGIGGKHYDFSAWLRHDTLALRGVREARRQAAVSEELRILYVALTRARERLELVGTVTCADLPKLNRRRGARAKSWLEWVGGQLGNSVGSVTAAAPATCGEDGCWEVQLQDDATIAPSAHPALQVTPRAQLELAVQRIGAPYLLPGSARLPAKVAITQLSEVSLEFDAERAVPLGEAGAAANDFQPSFVRQLELTAADAGTALHRLLAAMDPKVFARYADAAEVSHLRDELVRRGQLSRQHAELIPLSQVSRCAAELATTIPNMIREPFKSFAELPVSLLVPANELAATYEVEAASVGPERVQVQGAIDLLLDDGRTALVLDYKTGYTVDAAALQELHWQQLEWYCRAAAALLPGRRILWALYGLGGAGLVGPFEYGDAAVLLQSQQ